MSRQGCQLTIGLVSWAEQTGKHLAVNILSGKKNEKRRS